MEIVKVDINKIKEYEKNPKIHTKEQVEKIKKSIENYGFLVPIVIDENNEILMGHGRFRALKELGYSEADCIIKKGLSEKQKKALRIADNKVAESEYNLDLLIEELKKVEEEFTGFDKSDLDILGIDNEIFEEIGDEILEEEKIIPKMERRLNEHHDYIVFVFDNIEDFVNVATFFEVKRINESLSRKKKVKIGIGRVLDGKRIIELLEKVKNKEK